MAKHDVFISYSQPDKAIANAACARLEARGVRCWIAPRDVAAGVTWGAAIVDAISTSRVMVLIFSQHANASEQVLREVTTAVNRGVTIVPLRLDHEPLSQDLTYFLSPVHWLDALSPPLERHLDALCAAVLSLLGASPGKAESEANKHKPNAKHPLRRLVENTRILKSACVAVVVILIVLVAAWWTNGARHSNHNGIGDVSHPSTPPGDVSQITWKENNQRALLTLPGDVQMEFVLIAPGTAQMGGGPDRRTNVEHEVTLSKGYWIGTTEVTQAQWKSLMKSNPSVFIGDMHPVDSVSWNDCQDFIARLNESGAGKFRLPTEAEWEYACVANAVLQTRWDKREAYAWFGANSGQMTHPVATKRANEWGLYDVHGNVAEWCSDWMGPYAAAPQTNPVGPANGIFRVTRGGSWKGGPDQVRARTRGQTPQAEANSTVGFRIVRES